MPHCDWASYVRLAIVMAVRLLSHAACVPELTTPAARPL